MLKSPRSNNDTLGLGFTSIEVGETSKSVEQRSDKGKNSNPLFITIIRRGILLMFARVERSINRTHPKVKGIVTSVTYKDI